MSSSGWHAGAGSSSSRPGSWWNDSSGGWGDHRERGNTSWRDEGWRSRSGSGGRDEARGQHVRQDGRHDERQRADGANDSAQAAGLSSAGSSAPSPDDANPPGLAGPLYEGLVGRRDDRLCSELAGRSHCAPSWRRAFRAAGDGSASPDMVSIRQLRVLIWLQTEAWTSAARIPGSPDRALDLRAPAVTAFVLLPRQIAAPRSGPTVEVVSADMLEVAGDLAQAGAQAGGQEIRVAVLNMANARRPGGGVRTGAGAQEENFHRRSDLGRFLEQQSAAFYPIPPHACLLSREVTIFRGAEAAGYPVIAPFRVDVISSAAPAHPALDERGRYRHRRDRDAMWQKVELIMEAAEQSKCQALVLSAFGCGAFANPPDVVAGLFAQALCRPWSCLERVVFCILDDHNAGYRHNPRGNLRPFAEVFEHRGRWVRCSCACGCQFSCVQQYAHDDLCRWCRSSPGCRARRSWTFAGGLRQFLCQCPHGCSRYAYQGEPAQPHLCGGCQDEPWCSCDCPECRPHGVGPIGPPQPPPPAPPVQDQRSALEKAEMGLMD